MFFGLVNISVTSKVYLGDGSAEIEVTLQQHSEVSHYILTNNHSILIPGHLALALLLQLQASGKVSREKSREAEGGGYGRGGGGGGGDILTDKGRCSCYAPLPDAGPIYVMENNNSLGSLSARL